MKTLKYFILLIGLFALIHTNLNAQIGPATATGPMAGIPIPIPTVEMTVTSVTATESGEAQIRLTLTSDVAVTFEVAIENLTQDTITPTYSSPPSLKSYTEQIIFSGNIGDAVRVRCATEDFTGERREDSGCVVVIEPG